MWGDIFGGAASGAGMGYMATGDPTGAMVGATIGAMTGAVSGKEKEDAHKRQTELAARTQELSPWTGLRAKDPGPGPSQAGALMRGVGTGASMYAGAERMKQRQELVDAMKASTAAKAASQQATPVQTSQYIQRPMPVQTQQAPQYNVPASLQRPTQSQATFSGTEYYPGWFHTAP